MMAWAVFAVDDYDDTLNAALRENAIIADLLQEHTHRTIKAGETILRQLETALEQGEGGFDLGASPEVIEARLEAIAGLLPQVGSLWVFAANGDVLYTSLRGRVVTGRHDDRDYFQVHRDSAETGTFIGELLVGRLTGKSFFPISRRIDRPDGGFGGVVVAAIHTGYFQTFFADIAMPPGGTLALFRADGALMVRRPAADALIGQRYTVGMQGLTPEAPSRVSRGPSPIDGTDRLVARRRLSEYPLVALVTRSTADTLVPYWQRHVRTGLVVLLLALTAAVLTRLGLNALNADRRLKEALRDNNATLEDRVRKRTAELEQTLADKNLLLSEVYHRVKNNLQMVESLLALQARALTDTQALEAFRTARQRIHALGLVHQQLLGAGDLATVRLDSFLGELCANVAEGAGAERRGLRVEVDVAPLPADLDRAIPLGLLVNEALSNALLHGYPGGSAGVIRVKVERLGGGDSIRLSIRDDGKGCAGHIPEAGSASPPRSGLRIVRALVAQLDGTLTIHSDEGGTDVSVSLPWPVSDHA